MYKVIKFFTDLQDHNYAYQVGDAFPRPGIEVSSKRLEELSTTANRRKMPLIEEVREEITKEEVISEEETTTQEPVEDFMNPPEVPEDSEEVEEKPKKRRGRPRNDG